MRNTLTLAAAIAAIATLAAALPLPCLSAAEPTMQPADAMQSAGSMQSTEPNQPAPAAKDAPKVAPGAAPKTTPAPQPSPAREASPPAASNTAQPAPQPPAQPPAPPPVLHPAFFSPKTTIGPAETAMLAFSLKEPAPSDTALAAKVEPPGIIDILDPPAALKGKPTGYLRIRGLKPGSAKLSLQGASITIVVDPTRTRPVSAPVATAPADGSLIWGSIRMGVELFEATGDQPSQLALKTANGQLIKPATDLPPVDGPFRRASFEIDSSAFPPGPQTFTPVRLDGAREIAAGDPLTLIVTAKKPETILAGECENFLGTDRPRELGTEPPAVAVDAAASGHRFVQSDNARPAWYIDVNGVDKEEYMLVLRLRGEPASGAFPSLNLMDGVNGNVLGSARVAAMDWHRMPLTLPFKLKPGEHRLVLELANSFRTQGQPPRTLCIDSFEFVRLADPTAEDGDKGNIAFENGRALGSALFIDPPLDGLAVTGPLRVGYQLELRRNPRGIKTKIKLLVNGKPVMESAEGNKGSFVLPPHFLQAGPNTIRIEAALPGGIILRTAPQTLLLTAKTPPTAPLPTTERKFATQPGDPEWRLEMGTEATPTEDPNKREYFFASNNKAMITLPPDLKGDADVFVTLKGEVYDGPPEVETTLAVAGQPEQKLRTFRARPNWEEYKIGTLSLPGGGQEVTLRFTNDKFDEGKGDRNLHVGAVRAVVRVPADKTPPEVSLLYPKPGHPIAGADAVAVHVFDPSGIASLDVVVDGVAQNTPTAPSSNPAVLPILGNRIQPGKHTLSVAVVDRAGNKIITQPIEVLRPKQEPGPDHPYASAVRLLDRLAFGPEPAQLGTVLVDGPKKWLDAQLREPNPGDRAAFETSLAQYPQNNDDSYLKRPLYQLLTTPDPVRARFVFWAQNHFSTWHRKSGTRLKWNEYVDFEAAGISPFRDLLQTSASSPAMLVYLDQQRSFAGRINENYAREIMELHTLGVNQGYTQEDVTTLAAMLTGWTAQEESDPFVPRDKPVQRFRYVPYLNSGADYTILGKKLTAPDADHRFERVEAFLDLLAGHPNTARFVSRKLIRHYVAQPEPDQLVDALTKTYLESGGDGATLLRAIAESKELRETPTRLASPLDYGVRVLRIVESRDVDALQELLNRSGRGLFDCETPNGYPENNGAFADSNSLLQKWNFARRIEEALGRAIPSTLWAGDALTKPGANEKLIDFAAIRLTGRLPEPDSRKAQLDLLAEQVPDPRLKMLQLASFILQSPEAQVR